MKTNWLFIGLGVAVAAAAIAGGIAVLCRKGPRQTSDEDIDGGVVKRYWRDAPKVIKSAEIAEFHYEVSLFAVCDVDDLGYRVYTLDAVTKDGDVLIKYAWRERGGESDKAEYRTDASFMVRLQQIILKYDFAQYNGYYHTVSGLPDMYGESLDIVYASGEHITVHDNQSGFLPIDAKRELIMLFGAATKLENE